MAKRRRYKRRQTWSPYSDAVDNGCCGTGACMSCMTGGHFYTIALTAIMGMLMKRR